MKLSTELFLANLVILGALWYTAMHGMIATTLILFALMIGIRLWGRAAMRRENAADIAAMKERVRKILAKVKTDKP